MARNLLDFFALVPLSFEGHGAYDEQTRVAVYTKLLDFLALHLQGGQAYSQK